MSEPPPAFRVLSIIPAYNEADVIVPTIRALLDDGVEVLLVDNWSTDGTPQLVSDAFGDRVAIERFPASGDTGFNQWSDQLDRFNEIANQSNADWVTRHDADERRSGPWQHLNLRASLYRADMEGYNAVDHTVIEFPPVDNAFPAGSDYETYFTFFSPNEITANAKQIKAWKTREVDLRSSGGHEAVFPGRRVHPLNFLLKHYPVRSQAHGERKVLSERTPRITPEEKGRWHTHYDHVRAGHVFLRDPRDLIASDDWFAERWLLERLYGFTPLQVHYVPPAVHRALSAVLRRIGLLDSVRSIRRSYRLARRRHPDSGRR